MDNKFLYALVIALGLIGGAYVLSNSHLNITTTQTSVGQDGSITNAISVTGDGTSVTEPDLVTLTVNITEKDFSTKQAMQKTNGKISQVMAIAKKYGVDDKKIKTTQLSIRPVYEWENDRSVFKGYEASQSLGIESKYDKNSQNVSNILDEVASIDKVQIYGINFGFEDKKALAEQARELAYKSAEQKAMQLAKLSGVKLGKPISITDMSNQYNTTVSSDNFAKTMSIETFGASAPTTQISGGELEHKVNISVVFAIE